MLQRTLAIVALAVALAVTSVRADETKKGSPRRIDISVTEAGFEPSKVTVKQGEEVTLAFTRTSDTTCATEVIVHVNEKDTVEKKLPLNQAVPVTVTFSKTGELGYACGMNMHKGVIVVQ
jgi:plastocyanin domain-containing protein